MTSHVVSSGWEDFFVYSLLLFTKVKKKSHVLFTAFREVLMMYSSLATRWRSQLIPSASVVHKSQVIMSLRISLPLPPSPLQMASRLLSEIIL